MYLGALSAFEKALWS